jgi:CRISPR-associated endoribonuclease Cas6
MLSWKGEYRERAFEAYHFAAKSDGFIVEKESIANERLKHHCYRFNDFLASIDEKESIANERLNRIKAEFLIETARDFINIDMTILKGRGNMNTVCLYSAMLELQPSADTIVPLTTGHLVHALFLNLIKQFDEGLFSRLHDGPGPRPFTLSSLWGGQVQEDYLLLRKGIACSFRVTFLDGGSLWDRLRTQFLEGGPLIAHIGSTELRLTRMVSTPSASAPKWVGSTDWQTLAMHPLHHAITLHFMSPTAFSLSGRQFDLFPKPFRIWESLLRVWNTYAPEHLQLEKSDIRESFSHQDVVVATCDLQTETLSFPNYLQKGFTGTCTYLLQGEDWLVSRLTMLAAFAPYSGIGYKTTMGMGQVRCAFHEER